MQGLTDPTTQQLIVFVGSPGAGKSTFYWHKLQPVGVERVNQDLLMKKPRCVAAADALLREGKSVAIGWFSGSRAGVWMLMIVKR